LQRLLSHFGGGKARAAEHDHGVVDALFTLVQVRLEHFELHANATHIAAQHELGVGKRQSVGIGAHHRGVGRVFEQLTPGVSQAVFGDVLRQCLRVFHDGGLAK